MSNTQERAALKAVALATALDFDSHITAGSWTVKRLTDRLVEFADKAAMLAVSPGGAGSHHDVIRQAHAAKVLLVPLPPEIGADPDYGFDAPSPAPRAEPPVGEMRDGVFIPPAEGDWAEPPVGEVEALRLLFEGAFNGGASLQARHLSERGDTHGFRAYRDAIAAECLKAALRRVSASPANTAVNDPGPCWVCVRQCATPFRVCRDCVSAIRSAKASTASAQQRPTRCHVEEMTGDYCRWCYPNDADGTPRPPDAPAPDAQTGSAQEEQP